MKTLANLKELYEKDFYQWITENIELLKNKEFDLVDWENVIEELESIKRSELRSVISFMAVILEHLYKWENFKENNSMGNGWVRSINTSIIQLKELFDNSPSLKRKAKEEIDLAWKSAVRRLVNWFEDPENLYLAIKYFGRIPTGKDFPERRPYTIEQILDYKPWLKDLEE
ncbi:MAG TPA: DUF29 domain-containing protein [Sulfurihydrogenibium sp.]|uniref:DUF29 domain-containing protein n=1 Tax=Sulfurihydrogenibium sp. (strain YO3AOP1) TaxID=436114 RepID=UPI0001726702|nr:DUF29 domain-containing protein [Sulfurihydrogenibium sp. YO3AOP1]ACD66878.1 protein of unknown function DUF29 [Sulfurihydrogenibium sp. YO3AOP1]HBT98069.1 DUF29 domain-containing protein [Sulfurihydrogenibium sp.]